MFDLALAGAIVLLGLFISIISACRLWHMHWTTHKPLWWVLFMAAGAFGFLQFADGIKAIFYGADGINENDIFALVALAAYLWGSRVSWRTGPPKYLER